MGVITSKCLDCGGDRVSPGRRAYKDKRLKCYNKSKYRKNPELVRIRQIKYLYNITREQYLAILESQDWSCAICGDEAEDYSSLSVDHDHSCCPGKRSCGECVRGLLCTRCNRGIGYFRENVRYLSKASKYLKGWRQ